MANILSCVYVLPFNKFIHIPRHILIGKLASNSCKLGNQWLAVQTIWFVKHMAVHTLYITNQSIWQNHPGMHILMHAVVLSHDSFHRLHAFRRCSLQHLGPRNTNQIPSLSMNAYVSYMLEPMNATYVPCILVTPQKIPFLLSSQWRYTHARKRTDRGAHSLDCAGAEEEMCMPDKWPINRTQDHINHTLWLFADHFDRCARTYQSQEKEESELST